MTQILNKYRVEALTDIETATWVHRMYEQNKENCICGVCFGIIKS